MDIIQCAHSAVYLSEALFLESSFLLACLLELVCIEQAGLTLATSVAEAHS